MYLRFRDINIWMKFIFVGFLTTTDSETAGNFALKDQNMAMKWVKDNIAHFKGNPNRITLGGLVGGGAYVPMHMVSPASKGTSELNN